MSTISGAADSASSMALAAADAGTRSLMDQTQDRFLTLLVTQLRNQDPLNPMDNAQVTSQIAQLSTVNGINQLNNTLLALSGQMSVSQSMQAAGLIGKEVLVPGSKVSLGSDPSDPARKQATPFGVDLIAPAAKVVITLSDGAGQAVRRLELGPQATPGVLSLDWDGRSDGGTPLGDGAYTVQVAAMDENGAPVPAEALSYGRVASVSYASDGLSLDLGLGGRHSLLDVRKIM